MASTDAKPVPVKNQAYQVTFPIFDADGDLVAGATGLDSEISKDNGTFADCTNEATQLATASGMYYLDLTQTEMNADVVAIIIKSSEGKTTPIVLYPAEPADIPVDAQAISGSTNAADRMEASILTVVSGAAQAGTLSTTQMTTNLTEATDDHFNGRIIIWLDNALANQATNITDYDGASKMLTYTAVTEAPQAGDTFIIV